MSRALKLLDDMRGNPRDWRIQDVEALCAAEGIACTSPRKGSHYEVKHALISRILTIPAHRPIKPIYVRELVAFVDEVREAAR